MQIVDLTDVVQVTRGLVDIDSTTGREGDVVLWTATLLSQAGYEVVEQVVQGPRRNLYAAFGKADVVFSTHLDCVPPFFPSRLDGDTLHGRGSCDAKGAAACQIAALETLRREGITNVGLLLVVGEERGSDGAKTAHALASGSRYLVNGEPTDNRLGIGTRGILRVNLKASGRAAHSSFPELGDSAVEKLLDQLRAAGYCEVITNALAPGPFIVMLVLRRGNSLVKVIVPDTVVRSIVSAPLPAAHSPAVAPEAASVFAAIIASRNVHNPSVPFTASALLLTVMLAARGVIPPVPGKNCPGEEPTAG